MKTFSDKGSLKIRVNGEIDYIRNGYGDGSMYVGFTDDAEYCENCEHCVFAKRVEGTIDIYLDDCTNDNLDIIETLVGTYDIYTAPSDNHGGVIFCEVRK